MSLKKVTLLILMALVLVAASACGPSATATPAPTEEATEVATEEPTEAATEEATEEPTEEATEMATEEGTETAALPDLDGQVIRVAVENAYPPFNSIDTATGEAIGWDYDTVNEICSRLNCTAEFVQTSWDGMLVAIANGEFDMAADGITITAEREESVDFSIGYITVDQSILVRADETRFNTTQELIDETDILIGTQTGTTNYDVAIENFGEDRVRAYDLFPVAVQALINGDVDAVVMDNTAGLGYVGANPNDVKIIGTSLRSDPLGFAFPPNSELVAAVNAALESMMADGTLEEINRVWFVAPPEAEATEEATADATAEATP
jgi:polar amino acid transport system substrate-binding protein